MFRFCRHRLHHAKSRKTVHNNRSWTRNGRPRGRGHSPCTRTEPAEPAAAEPSARTAAEPSLASSESTASDLAAATVSDRAAALQSAAAPLLNLLCGPHPAFGKRRMRG